MTYLRLRPDPRAEFTRVVGVGGIGTGTIFALEGNHTLGRNESRMGTIVNAHDYCKLHIVEHYIAALLGLSNSHSTFDIVAIGNVGKDSAGTMLLQEMTDIGINTRYVRVEPESRTMFSAVFLYPDNTGGNITAANSACSKLSTEQLVESRHLLSSIVGRSIALCLPEVPLDKRAEFLGLATDCGSYRVASFASGEMNSVCQLKLLANVDLLALNREEATQLAGCNPHGLSHGQLLDACAEKAQSMNSSMNILVSTGPDGAYIFDSGHWSQHEVVPMNAKSTAGAGDALLAGTIAGLIAGMPLTVSNDAAPNGKKSINSAIDLGLALAAFSVTSPHTIHPEAALDTLLRFTEANGFPLSQSLNQVVIEGDPASTPAVEGNYAIRADQEVT